MWEKYQITKTILLTKVILIVNFIDFTPLSVGTYVLEDWAQALGWCMALVTVVGIPVFAAIEIWKSYKDPDFEGLTFKQVW